MSERCRCAGGCACRLATLCHRLAARSQTGQFFFSHQMATQSCAARRAFYLPRLGTTTPSIYRRPQTGKGRLDPFRRGLCTRGFLHNLPFLRRHESPARSSKCSRAAAMNLPSVSARRSMSEADGLDSWARGYHTCAAAGTRADMGAATRVERISSRGLLTMYRGQLGGHPHFGAASGGLPFWGGARGARGMSQSVQAHGKKMLARGRRVQALCPALVSLATTTVGRAMLRR